MADLLVAVDEVRVADVLLHEAGPQLGQVRRLPQQSHPPPPARAAWLPRHQTRTSSRREGMGEHAGMQKSEPVQAEGKEGGAQSGRRGRATSSGTGQVHCWPSTT
jgi:hypothetical protein